MISKLFNKFWHSPTLTSWANKIAASARLFFVLPLMLNRFDDVELAAWFLFASIFFFSGLVATQINLVLCRMVSVAFGGAKDFRVISAESHAESSGVPNWPLLERLYGSMASIHLVSSLLGVVISLPLGWFSLSAIVRDYSGGASIWIAFMVFLLGQFLVQIYARHATMLRGLNKVALTNRWEAFFALLSAIAGGVALWFGGGIIHLAVVMQSFYLAGVLSRWALLMYIVEPRFKAVPLYRIDRQIMAWIWKPLWRSYIQAVANRGSSKVATIILARHMDPTVLTGLLLSLRLLDTLEDIAIIPMSSHVPRLGRLLAQGNIDHFRFGIKRALKMSFCIQVLGICAIAFLVYVVLGLINSDLVMLSQSLFLILALAHFLASQIRQSLMISIIGNNIIGVYRLSLAAILSTVMSMFLIPHYQVIGFILSAYLPILLILNIYPLSCGCDLIGVPTRTFICRICVLPWLLLVVVLLVSFLVPWELWSLNLSDYIKTLI